MTTKKIDKIRAVVKRPGEAAFMTVINNELETLQKIVGGYIETITIADNLVIVCNEEGKLKNLPKNCNACGVDFVGPIIFLGVSGDEFSNIPLTYSKFRDLFPNLWEV